MANEKYADYRVSVLPIGKKADDFFKNTELHIIGSDMPKRLHKLYDDLTFEKVAAVADKIMENFILDEFDRFVTDGVTVEERKMGAMWMLRALVDVSSEAANALPYLVQVDE